MLNRIGLFAAVLLVVLLLLPTPVDAGSYRVGYTDQNGYQFNNNGRWQKGGVEYYRTATETSGYWHCGVYTPGYISYSYEAYVAPVYAPPYVPPAIPAYTEDGSWKRDLIKYARQRQDFAEYLEAVKTLGLAVPPQYQQQYGLQGSYYSQTQTGYGASANTLYAYGAQKSLYDTADLMTLYQMASQHTLNAQQLSGQGASDFKALLAQESASRARIAEIVAKRDLALALLQSLNSPNSIQTQGYKFQVTPQGDINRDDSKVTPEVKAKLLDQWKGLAATKCAGCHGAEKPAGGFDVSTYPSLSQENKEVVWKRLTSADPKTLMPRTKDGGPGTPLTASELQLFFAN